MNIEPLDPKDIPFICEALRANGEDPKHLVLAWHLGKLYHLTAYSDEPPGGWDDTFEQLREEFHTDEEFGLVDLADKVQFTVQDAE